MGRLTATIPDNPKNRVVCVVRHKWIFQLGAGTIVLCGRRSLLSPVQKDFFATHGRSDMGKRLEGKVPIISGGATGMGGAASRLFAAEGAKVAASIAMKNRQRQS